MPPPDSDRRPPDDASPDAGAAAREAAAAAKVLARQLGILAAGAARGAGRRGREAARATGSLVGGLAARRRSKAPAEADAPIAGPATAGSAPSRFAIRGRSLRPALLVAGAVVALPLVALAGYVLFAFLTLPPLGGVVIDQGQRALTVEADDGRVFATRGTFRGQPITKAELPPHLAQAIVAIEDRRFYSHWGIDLRGLVRAAWRNAVGGGVREGGSSITQQYVRLTSLNQEKTLRRKIQEAFLALRVESEMSKDDILLGYLNTAYFGAGAYGADAAARRYFGKGAKALTLPEAAMLAGLVRAPSQLAPTRNFGGAKERADVVLQTMVETGAITAEAADAARAKTVTLRTPPETPPGSNYFLDLLAADAKKLTDAPGDLTVRSTLNLDLQSLAEGIVARRLDAEGGKKKIGQGALVAMSKDGAILAMVGGRDYEDSQFNRATQAKRQAGSLFKLFVYLTAYENGLTPETVLVDRPVQIGDWEPQNANNRFRGAVPLRTAFALSINTVAAQLGEELGIPAVIATAKSLGVQSELPNVPSLALGSAEVTLLEMTRAYAGVLANRTPVESFDIHAIRGGAPAPLYLRPDAKPAAGLPGDSRTMMLDSLQAVVDGGTGKGARVSGLAVGGKTGTTQDYRDAWFIGMTPDMVVGVWVGNDDNSAMNRVGGGDVPASIFRDFVQRASAQMAKGRKRPSAVKAEPQPAEAAPPAPAAAAPAAGPEARGVPEVIDTGTLSFRGRTVRLAGVDGQGGHLARQLARYLRRREVVCAPDAGGTQGSRCRIDGDDLAALILSAGGARASEDAPPDLLAAEEQARSERTGMWGGRR
ncbi:PBP1A family penicillin-binding protein [Methylobacterium sp. WL30]|uniref:PBP1A family penicillin-binding protein n=2 Tax=Methylobacterium TaxID=407 RepID=UPI0011C9ED40|nr:MULTISPECIES: PBP1A family penicillin-binding protein [unclassified Methylobacterium]TXN53117.1 PBP1A family penicillin-binding protein [Methylobacterium sp. WL119]TXN70880.1 PBP1A family penicillin-binding protein [Methylobacterium sp. WL30]